MEYVWFESIDFHGLMPQFLRKFGEKIQLPLSPYREWPNGIARVISFGGEHREPKDCGVDVRPVSLASPYDLHVAPTSTHNRLTLTENPVMLWRVD